MSVWKEDFKLRTKWKKGIKIGCRALLIMLVFMFYHLLAFAGFVVCNCTNEDILVAAVNTSGGILGALPDSMIESQSVKIRAKSRRTMTEVSSKGAKVMVTWIRMTPGTGKSYESASATCGLKDAGSGDVQVTGNCAMQLNTKTAVWACTDDVKPRLQCHEGTGTNTCRCMPGAATN